MAKNKDLKDDSAANLMKLVGNKKKAETPRQMVVPESELAELKAQAERRHAKMGRPSDKDEDVEYVKICAKIPEQLRDDMRMAMLTKFKGKHITQDGMIEEAIRRYINK